MYRQGRCPTYPSDSLTTQSNPRELVSLVSTILTKIPQTGIGSRWESARNQTGCLEKRSKEQVPNFDVVGDSHCDRVKAKEWPTYLPQSELFDCALHGDKRPSNLTSHNLGGNHLPNTNCLN